MVGCEHAFPLSHPTGVGAGKAVPGPVDCQSNTCTRKNIKEVAQCKNCKKLFCRPCFDHFDVEPSTSVARTADGCRPR